ncbi:hypothetical protein [Rhodopirellula halodulae]|uniref:hypothetical protein n=1 Tax=Rhodopirellula halodulae TaxID=2894198 RepID=UPI001E32AF14|nr:hypothetical protein [Rhodopirellula sp. JC737]MCC9654363.1 hypothetical protein [Rhodopirellula sp. JC737]
MSRKKKPASFTIRIKGDGVDPESIPVRTLSEAASAVMRLAVGDSKSEASKVRVLDVKRGSAMYPCLIDDGHDVNRNLVDAGEAASNPMSEKLDAEMLGPIRELSLIAGKYDAGSVEIYLGEVSTRKLKEVRPVVVFNGGTYSAIESSVIVRDTASIRGYLVGVGGAQERKCRIRIPDRSKLLYCKVPDQDLSRELGECLYTYVTLYGRGTYFQRTWWLLDFEVFELEKKSDDSVESILGRIREASGDGWSNVQDVDAELRSLR